MNAVWAESKEDVPMKQQGYTKPNNEKRLGI
jgi:hypothetical protein